MTLLAAVMATVQVFPLDESHPDQLEREEPLSGAAVRVTDVPEVYEDEHVEPQLIPAGLLVIVPVPVPDLVTLKV